MNNKEEKSKLRKIFFEQRENFTSIELEDTIRNFLSFIVPYLKSTHGKNLFLASYLGNESEFPSIKLLERLHATYPHLTIFAPRILSKIRDGAQMDFFPLSFIQNQVAIQLLEKQEWGILEPKAEETMCLSSLYQKSKTTVIFLLPGLAFDRNGTRLGYGGGYYDRYLENFEVNDILKVAIAHPSQLSPVDLPAEKWDAKVDVLITPEEIITIKN